MFDLQHRSIFIWRSCIVIHSQIEGVNKVLANIPARTVYNGLKIENLNVLTLQIYDVNTNY